MDEHGSHCIALHSHRDLVDALRESAVSYGIIKIWCTSLVNIEGRWNVQNCHHFMVIVEDTGTGFVIIDGSRIYQYDVGTKTQSTADHHRGNSRFSHREGHVIIVLGWSWRDFNELISKLHGAIE